MIAEIIDHNRALIDGPSTSVARQAIPYRKLVLTPYTIAKLPRGAGSGAVKKAFEKSGVAEKWAASAWSKKLEARQVRKVSRAHRRRRRGGGGCPVARATDAVSRVPSPGDVCWMKTPLPSPSQQPKKCANMQEATDFDRFQIMLAKKQRRDAVRKAHFKERKASA